MAPTFVLDCSVAMSWCFRDEGEPYAGAVLEAMRTRTAVVPSVWPLEVANVLVVGERRQRITRAEAARFLAFLQQIPIRKDAASTMDRMGELLDLARTHSLSTYDASYLDCAMRLGLPLATLDAGLRNAAKQCHVSLFRGS